MILRETGQGRNLPVSHQGGNKLEDFASLLVERTVKGGDPMKVKTKVKAGGVVLTGAD